MSVDLKEFLPILSSLIFLAIALTRILEVLVKNLFKKIKKEKSPTDLTSEVLSYLSDSKKTVLTDEERNQLRYLVEFHSKTDNNGIPLGYFPRNFEENQKEIVTILNKLINFEEKTAVLLEYALDKLNHLDHKK